MIRIKPSHRGLFTKEAKNAGMSIGKFTNKVLLPTSKASKVVKKRAQFRRNSMTWNR